MIATSTACNKYPYKTEYLNPADVVVNMIVVRTIIITIDTTTESFKTETITKDISTIIADRSHKSPDERETENCQVEGTSANGWRMLEEFL